MWIIFAEDLLDFRKNITTFDDKEDSNGIIFYEQCNKILKKHNNHKNIQNFAENLCIFIINNENKKVTILSKNKNVFWLELIDEKTLEYLKQKYYRGEKVNIYLSWTKKDLEQILSFDLEKYNIEKYDTLDTDYKIKFLDDNLLNDKKYNILNKKCEFNSYLPNCLEKHNKDIIKKIDDMFIWNIFNLKKLLKSSLDELKKEKLKINKINKKISKLDYYFSKKQDNLDETYYTDNIQFTIMYLIYKLDIYNLLLDNRIWDLEFNMFLKENNIYYIDKKLIFIFLIKN